MIESIARNNKRASRTARTREQDWRNSCESALVFKWISKSTGRWLASCVVLKRKESSVVRFFVVRKCFIQEPKGRKEEKKRTITMKQSAELKHPGPVSSPHRFDSAHCWQSSPESRHKCWPHTKLFFLFTYCLAPVFAFLPRNTRRQVYGIQVEVGVKSSVCSRQYTRRHDKSIANWPGPLSLFEDIKFFFREKKDIYWETILWWPIKRYPFKINWISRLFLLTHLLSV